jgi:hypothetical protein
MLFTRNNGHSENLVDAIYPENVFSIFLLFLIFLFGVLSEA